MDNDEHLNLQIYGISSQFYRIIRICEANLNDDQINVTALLDSELVLTVLSIEMWLDEKLNITSIKLAINLLTEILNICKDKPDSLIIDQSGKLDNRQYVLNLIGKYNALLTKH